MIFVRYVLKRFSDQPIELPTPLGRILDCKILDYKTRKME